MSRRMLVPLGLVALPNDPTGNFVGETYFNTTNKLIYTYDGTSWVASSGGGGTTPVSTFEAAITSNSAVTLDFLAVDSFYVVEYTLTIKQGAKIRTSKVLMHTDGTAVDYTESNILELGGAISGVVVECDKSGSNARLRATVTDAASTSAHAYGIRTVIAAAATAGLSVSGGTLSSDSTYYYNTFTASDNLVVSGGDLTADILVVAGGGGTGYAAGGGGAGGLVYLTGTTLSGTKAVTIGAGGAGSDMSGGYPTNGGDSQVGSLTAALGGGYGGCYTGADYISANTGGSGGGAAFNPVSAAAGGTPGQGHSGSYGYQDPGGGAPRSGGGGGGAGGDAPNGYAAHGGAGGIGSGDYSDWATATGTGDSGYYAGGGGGSGSSYYGGAGGAGGLGGGGAGSFGGDTPGTAMANTGGGAAADNIYDATGKTGGSGIVIVRYLKSAVGG